MRDTSWLAASRTRSAWLFLAPMLVILLLVAGWPLLRTIWLGFTDANTLRIDQAKWIGFQNFLTHRFRLDLINELLNDFEVDVGFQQRQSDFAQRLLDVFLGKRGLTAQGLERALQFFLKILKHRCRSYSSSRNREW